MNNFFGRAAQDARTTIQVPADSSASPRAVAQVTAAAQVQANAIVAAPAEQPVTSAALHAQSRDRTGGATGTTIAAQIDAHFSPPTSPPVTAAAQEAASAEAAPVEQRVPRSALGVSGCDSEENYASNRFDKSELCFECGNPHIDSNYVATTANGYTWCGNCWDVFYDVTIIVSPQLQRDREHSCPCNRDLYAEPSFAVDQTAQQTAYCSACCLIHWGLRRTDVTITVVDEERM